MEKYFGPLNTRTKLMLAAHQLETMFTNEHRSAAKFIYDGWQRVAARPDLQLKIVALLNSPGLDCRRPGSIMSKLLQDREVTS